MRPASDSRAVGTSQVSAHGQVVDRRAVEKTQTGEIHYDSSNRAQTLKSCKYSKKLNAGRFRGLWPDFGKILAHFWPFLPQNGPGLAPCGVSRPQPCFPATYASKPDTRAHNHCAVSHPRAANLSTRQLTSNFHTTVAFHVTLRSEYTLSVRTFRTPKSQGYRSTGFIGRSRARVW